MSERQCPLSFERPRASFSAPAGRMGQHDLEVNFSSGIEKRLVRLRRPRHERTHGLLGLGEFSIEVPVFVVGSVPSDLWKLPRIGLENRSTSPREPPSFRVARMPFQQRDGMFGKYASIASA